MHLRRIFAVLAALLPMALAATPSAGQLEIAGGGVTLRLDVSNRCVLSGVWVDGRRVSGEPAAFTGIMVSNQWFTSCSNQTALKVTKSRDEVVIHGVRIGPTGDEVEEEWTFQKAGNAEAPGVSWLITRSYPRARVLQDSVLPAWNFGAMTNWTGALLNNGGVAWNRYLDTPGATYGVNASAFVCWNKGSKSALSVACEPVGPSRINTYARFTRERDGSHTAAFYSAASELRPKHDLRRFHPNGPDIWAPFAVAPGKLAVRLQIAAVDYEEAYDLGNFRGINEKSVREMLHTIGRYGVVDRRIAGANGWRSGFKCLHEQWFSQMGIALQDPDYVRNCAETFDYERDHALLPDGRLKSRWWWVAGDAMPGTYDKLGYYEAQWGMLLDSQTCFPICVAELFDLTGDRAWLARHKQSCERLLNYLLHRDSDDDGLVEMLNSSHSEGKGSDWIDVIWAAHENALINAELYYALTRWVELEKLLGDNARADSFRAFAQKLKTSFNRNTDAGGFWDPQNRWFVYWRDQDDSIHGNNLVTPVNFAAISYGLCEEPGRREAILNRIEAEMQKENLFYWPLSFFPYEPGEGHPTVNYPFPKYENGDIFLSWGELAVRAYAPTRPDIALKYIRNTLKQYERDGLSFQRYERVSQKGAGDDILAGNIMPIVGLYRDIFGLQPKHDRLFVNPHFTPELEGTQLRYRLRNQKWQVTLSESGTRLAVENFSVRHHDPFALNAANGTMHFFAGDTSEQSLRVTTSPVVPVSIDVQSWETGPDSKREWSVQSSAGHVKLKQTLSGLHPNASYRLSLNGNVARTLRADASGELLIEKTVTGMTLFLLRQ